MTESTFIFKCLGHTERNDGMIASYTIEVTSLRNSRVEVLKVEPDHLASARSIKQLLLKRGMFYTTKQKQHAQMLMCMFDNQQVQPGSGNFE